MTSSLKITILPNPNISSRLMFDNATDQKNSIRKGGKQKRKGANDLDPAKAISTIETLDRKSVV